MYIPWPPKVVRKLANHKNTTGCHPIARGKCYGVDVSVLIPLWLENLDGNYR
jgi:hypothetical protein